MIGLHYEADTDTEADDDDDDPESLDDGCLPSGDVSQAVDGRGLQQLTNLPSQAHPGY